MILCEESTALYLIVEAAFLAAVALTWQAWHKMRHSFRRRRHRVKVYY